MNRARLERQVRELALEHAAARLDDADYFDRMARLRGELEIVGAQPARDLPARVAQLNGSTPSSKPGRRPN